MPEVIELFTKIIQSEKGRYLWIALIVAVLLVMIVFPYIDANFRTMPQREYTALAGSSMGGLMALYGICDYNHIFRKVACISPSFWISKDKVLDMVERATIAMDSTIYMCYNY